MTKTIAAAMAALAIGAGGAHAAPPPACSILNVDTPRLARGEVWSTVDIYCRRGVQVLAVDAALQRSDHRRAIYGAPFMDYGRTRPGVLHPHAYTPCGTRRRGYRWRAVVTLVYGERTSRPARVVVRRSAWTPRLIWCSGDVTVRR